MAKRKSKRSYNKTNKIEPSVLTLNFVTPLTAPGALTNSTIDLSQVASLINRRFYRQGINWAVAGFKVFSAAGAAGSISIQKLPNTWIMSNAWEKSMRTWLEMSNQVIDGNESVRPRFMDFKIYADSEHHQKGVIGNLLPFNLDAAGVQQFATAGDWDYSTIHIPDTDNFSGLQRVVTEFDLIATGASYPGVSPVTTRDGVSLIEGYAASRALPNLHDPNTPGDMEDIQGTTPENWLTAIFNEGLVQEDRVMADLREQNNVAPYPFENDVTLVDTMYPGGANQLPGLQIHDGANISGTTIGGTTYLKGGNFPCGLIRVVHGNDPSSTSTSLSIQIDLVPGNHRGYMCENMTEM